MPAPLSVVAMRNTTAHNLTRGQQHARGLLLLRET